jgi:rhamnogalacturonan endolyase
MKLVFIMYLCSTFDKPENRAGRECMRAVTFLHILVSTSALLSPAGALAQQRSSAGWQMEKLDRGLIAVPSRGGVLVSWRLLASDPRNIAFDVFRDGRKLNSTPLRGGTNFFDPNASLAGRYSVAVRGGARTVATPVWNSGYLSIPLDVPSGGKTPTGEAFTYAANDASVGDVDGDGRYEIILKWDPSNSKDNAFAGFSGPVLFDAYTLDGKRLWRIDMGRNIRAGAHYTQFLVYDFDGDGRAELIAKTGDGTVDGTGKVIGDAKADWRGGSGEVEQKDRTGATTLPDGRMVARLEGRILRGPEYLTVFDGRTGRAMATVPYVPPRSTNAEPTAEELTQTWGDAYGNRSDRHNAAVAFLDGKRPSAVMARGYYARSTMAAYDWRNGKLSLRWLFDSSAPGNAKFASNGNHQLSVADVDGDGRDEVIAGAMVVDDDGKGLWSAGLGHGDAMHVSDLDPSRPGLEKFGVHENMRQSGNVGAAMLDARTGEVLWTTKADKDTGRGVAFDVDPRYPGAEAWASNSTDLHDVKGRVIGKRPNQMNFAVWWEAGESRVLLDAAGATSNNGTKANPVLSADILGDWREEVILRAEDGKSLRIYATPFPTQHRMATLMHDRQYRLAVAWQNGAYNQPPHPSFYIGETDPAAGDRTALTTK